MQRQAPIGLKDVGMGRAMNAGSYAKESGDNDDEYDDNGYDNYERKRSDG